MYNIRKKKNLQHFYHLKKEDEGTKEPKEGKIPYQETSKETTIPLNQGQPKEEEDDQHQQQPEQRPHEEKEEEKQGEETEDASGNPSKKRKV